MRCLLALVAAVLLVHLDDAKSETESSDRGLPSPDDVVQALLSSNVNASFLAQEGDKYHGPLSNARPAAPSSVLGFVTPWNARGYDLAKRFKSKLTHVSPVWYQLVPGGDGRIAVQGQHDVDAGWVEDLRSCDAGAAACGDGFKPTRVVPRFNLELDGPSLHAALMSPERLVAPVVAECVKHEYDGIVLEAWPTLRQYVYSGNAAAAEAAYALVAALAAALRARRGAAGTAMQLILAVPPSVAPGGAGTGFQGDEFRRLRPSVDLFAWMTYDFGPAVAESELAANAPMGWLRDNLAALLPKGPESAGANQTLLGLNFYGWEFCGSGPPSAKLAHDFVAILARQRPGAALPWSEQLEEHSLRYKRRGERCVLWYPTPRAVAARLALATEHGLGLSIWELGQGLTSFFDLL